GGQLDALTRRRLHRYADGNPLLLRELLADALEAGVLVRRDGVWRWRGEMPGGARVAELVAERLSTLDTPVREVLELIACGEPLALSVLERLADPTAIETAERSGLAVADRSGARVALRLTHPLYGEVLRAGLPVARARSLWGRLASVLADGPSRRHDDALLAAVWQLESGTANDPGVLVDAARQAVGRFELALAERLARAARSAPKSAGGGGSADLLLAQILCWRGRGREAALVLPAAPPPGERPLWAVTRADILYWGQGQPHEAERVLEEVPPAAPGAELAQASRSWILFFDGRCRAALSAAERVLNQDGAADQAVVWAAMSGVAAAGALGQIEAVRAIAARGNAVADANADRFPWAQAQLGYGLCLALRATGSVDELGRLAEAGYRAAVASDASMSTAIWAAWRGTVAIARGRVADAEAALREAVALLEVDDSYHLVRVCLAELATAMALSGDASAARALLARADPSAVPGVNRVFEPLVEMARAWAEAAGGAPGAAARTARRAATLARETEQPAVEATCLFDAARLGAANLVYERLATLAGRLGGQMAEAYARAARGLAQTEPGELAAAAAVFAGQGHLVLAAEAEAAAARAYVGATRSTAARAARERSAALVSEFQGVRTPLLEAASTGTVLTRREREVAMLALTRTSRQIAEQLGLSVNTVNNTLARAFGKLSVSNRRQLAEALGTDSRSPGVRGPG
ncbi:MAG: hypothetical protein J2P15_18605, partial [Micromonosporaceae bacterium]|nr:hypothetical protein [Micromonosporaceae bacterium]